jgi:hypothetical protein
MRAGLSRLRLVVYLAHFLCLGLRSRTSLRCRESTPAQATCVPSRTQVKARRADNPTRLTLVLLSNCFNWRDALTLRPRTFVAWHRKGFRHFWCAGSLRPAGGHPCGVPTTHLENRTRQTLVGQGADRQRTAIDHVRAGAAKAGRTLDDFEICANLFISISEDEKAARDAVRPFMATLLSFMTSQADHPMFTAAGFEPGEIRQFGEAVGTVNLRYR